MGASDHLEQPKERKSELHRAGNYQETCKAAGHGFNHPPVNGKNRSEVHHILCDHSIDVRREYYRDAETGQYIEACLEITDWDINNKDNLIGLPRNRQFRECYGSEPESSWQPVNLPSHHVDHNTADGYTFEVSKWLKANVWDTLNAKQKAHEVDAKKIKDQLEQGSKHFLEKLHARGSREQGTKMGWKARHDKGYERRWYHSFSMGKKPRPRHPGVSHTNLTGIFTQLS